MMMAVSYERTPNRRRQYRVGICDTCHKAGVIDGTDMKLRPETRIALDDMKPDAWGRVVRPHHNSQSKHDGWLCNLCSLAIYASSPSEAKTSYSEGVEE